MSARMHLVCPTCASDPDHDLDTDPAFEIVTDSRPLKRLFYLTHAGHGVRGLRL